MKHDGRTRPNYPASSSLTSNKPDDLDVVIITQRDDQCDLLIRELRRLCMRVRYLQPSKEPLPIDADVIYCDLTADLSQQITWQIGEARAALVVILSQTESLAPEALEAVTPDAVLARPFTSNAVRASFFMARSQFRYERRLRSKVDRLEENLRAMRIIERAKAILMSSHDLNAEQAYAIMRDRAMAQRISVSNVASAVVASSESDWKGTVAEAPTRSQ